MRQKCLNQTPVHETEEAILISVTVDAPGDATTGPDPDLPVEMTALHTDRGTINGSMTGELNAS